MHYETQSSPTSVAPTSVQNVRVSGNADQSRDDERISLAPLSPEAALHALLATPPIHTEAETEG